MKKTALIWINIVMFPLTVLLTGFTAAADILIPASLIMFLAGTAVSFTGYFVRRKFYGKEKQDGRWVYVTELFAGFAASGVCAGLSGFALLVPAVYMFACFLTGTRVYDKELKRSTAAGLAIASFVLDAVVGNSLKNNYGISFLLIIIPMIIMSVMWMYLLNYMNISGMVKARNYNEKYLPPKIRSFNFRITSVIAGVTAVILATYKLVSAFLWNSVLRPAMEVIADIISDVEIHPDDLNPENAHLQNAGNGGTPELNPYAGILQAVCMGFVFLVLAFLLWLMIKNGIFSKLFRYIVLSIRNFTSHGKKKETAASPDGYTDTVENLEDNVVLFASLRERRKWNSEYKKFASMENGREKFRFGYSLVLSWINLHRTASTEGLTPKEITEKSGFGEYVGDFTDRYYPVRYDDAQCGSDDFTAAEKTLDKLRKLK